LDEDDLGTFGGGITHQAFGARNIALDIPITRHLSCGYGHVTHVSTPYCLDNAGADCIAIVPIGRFGLSVAPPLKLQTRLLTGIFRRFCLETPVQ
jgi:hypothetical protein